MQIVSDGIIFESQAQGGVSRIYQEIFPRMCDMDQTLRIALLTSGKLLQRLPIHASITNHFFPPLEYLIRPTRSYFMARKKVRAFLQYTLLSMPQNGIWSSTYYTLPYKWQGTTVVFVHDMIHERFPEMFKGASFNQFREYKQECVTTADAIVCISAATKQEVKKFYHIDEAKFHVVPLAHSPVFTAVDDSYQFKHLPFRKPFLLYIGGRTNHKNFNLLLTAYSRWQKKKETNLVVVGPEWSKQEKQLIEQYGLTEQISLIINADDNTLFELYHQALAFVYPSLYEGFGIPLLEAMACNCPIVASRIPSTIEVAGDYPIYFQADNHEALIDALETAYKQSAAIKRTKLGLELASRYSWNHTADQVLKIYRALS